MNSNKHFSKYYSKLRFEAVIKALVAGLSVGFVANFIAALVTWFTPVDGLWISLGVLVGVSAIATLLFYFKRFRPNAVSNARRLDRLGLEERLVTMIEYENDESYIAAAQRADAKASLEKVDKKDIRITRCICGRMRKSNPLIFQHT